MNSCAICGKATESGLNGDICNACLGWESQ